MAIIENQKVTAKWNSTNKKYFEELGYKYTKMQDEFEVPIQHLSKGSKFLVEAECDYCSKVFLRKYESLIKSPNHYCNVECKREGVKKGIKTNCGNCEKEITILPSRLKHSESGLSFCGNKCVGEYNSKRHLNNRVFKNCLICNKEYNVKPSEAEKSVTCSRECHSKWQSQYLTGENANNYNHSVPKENRTGCCDWCNEEFDLKYPYKVKLKEETDKSLFCSKACYRDWYAKEWSQQEEWREISRKRTVNMICNGTFNHTETEPQIILNKMLESLEIKYINEYNCKYYSVDNYLIDYNLMIEVNGGFWHCDPRKYNNISYQQQYDRIISDKRKRSSILKNYGINILYLWEKDLIEDSELCLTVLKSYVDNNGVLNEYDSFNYDIVDGKLVSSDKYTPYINYDIKKLNAVFIPTSGIKRSKKQDDKWIIFNCEQCCSEKEQLISKYNKSKHHFCSPKCRYDFYRKS